MTSTPRPDCRCAPEPGHVQAGLRGNGRLASRGVRLRTSAGQYRKACELPGWYPSLAAATPASTWTATETEEDFRRACRTLGTGPAVVRAYVKSMKHYWDEACTGDPVPGPPIPSHPE